MSKSATKSLTFRHGIPLKSFLPGGEGSLAEEVLKSASVFETINDWALTFWRFRRRE